LSALGSRRRDLRICPMFLALVGFLLGLMLISLLRIHCSHFEGFYLWYRYAFFAFAFLSFANYARYQAAQWKGLLLGTVVAVSLGHLLPDLLRHGPVAGFSQNNSNYFATLLLIGLAASIAGAVFGWVPKWRAAALGSAAVILLGVVKTSSRGATLAAIVMIVIIARRGRGRVPRQVWLVAGLL